MKKYLFLLCIIVILVIAKFWIGFYTHDEFYGEHIFIKHRPIWKSHFHSPRGMSDLKLIDMSEQNQKEQRLFNEFVLDNLQIE